jgi:2-isopropylmalate synthase
MKKDTALLYDTTCRDGAQMQGIQFSAQDKLAIAQTLDRFGIDYIELGWPGANPVDDKVFEQLASHPLQKSKWVAFGATCKPGIDAKEDPQLSALLNSGAPVVTLVAKSSRFHIEKILETTVSENIRMITDSVAHCKSRGKEVWLDAEHFFDGFKSDASVSMQCLKAAVDAGVDGVVLCDTNGGTLPSKVSEVVAFVKRQLNCAVGIHAHNDCELAVANALAAIESGASMVQGTINGYGERCGNTNLISLIPTLQLKLEQFDERNIDLKKLTELSRVVASRSNKMFDAFAPYVGDSAFAHKAGLHASAMHKHRQSYEHIDPESVGNQRKILVSNQAGRSNLKQKVEALNCTVDNLPSALSLIKQKEACGFQFEEGDASLTLLLKRMDEHYVSPFAVQEFSVTTSSRASRSISSTLPRSLGNASADLLHHAAIKVMVAEQSFWSAAEGNGPVEAIDKALKASLNHQWPELHQIELTDYKVRILDPESATAATTHVWIESKFRENVWQTIGCSTSIIDASRQALCDSLEYFIQHFVTGEFVTGKCVTAKTTRQALNHSGLDSGGSGSESEKSGESEFTDEYNDFTTRNSKTKGASNGDQAA